MKRLLALCALLAAGQPQPPPIQINVGPGTAVEVRIPRIAKKDLRDIVSTFFGRGDEAARQRFEQVFGKSESLTLVLTSKD